MVIKAEAQRDHGPPLGEAFLYQTPEHKARHKDSDHYS